MGATWTAVRQQVIPLLKETWADFQRHNAQWLAAAIAYFTMFAIAPLIIVLVELAGIFLGQHQKALHELYGYLSSSAGKSAAAGIKGIVEATFSQRRAGTIAQIIGWVTFVFAAVGLFQVLQQALNTVWDIEPRKQSIWETVKQRATSFGVVLVIGFVLLVSLGVNAVLTVATAALIHVAPFFPVLFKILDFAISLGIITLLFALLFEYLPECRIEWRDVWVGAAVSALLFVVGEFLLGWYLGRAGVSTTFGTFGSLVVFLVWVFYTAQILLLGAEFTHVYARNYGSRSSQTSRGEISYQPVRSF